MRTAAKVGCCGRDTQREPGFALSSHRGLGGHYFLFLGAAGERRATWRATEQALALRGAGKDPPASLSGRNESQRTNAEALAHANSQLCTTLEEAKDQNRVDPPQQNYAWSLFDKALTTITTDQRQHIDWQLVTKAQREWEDLASEGAPEAMMRELVEQADAVITGSGD